MNFYRSIQYHIENYTHIKYKKWTIAQLPIMANCEMLFVYM